MPQTKAGAIKAKQTIIEKYGADYWKKMGAEGGKKGTTGGFYYSKANGLNTHITAGAKGGRISRRNRDVTL